MERKRSKGVTFWGNLLICIGIIYGLINAARNIWRVDYVFIPIIDIVIGVGILYLKNWARITFLVIAILLVLTGILGLPYWIESIGELSKEGIPLLIISIVAFLSRFAIGIGGLIFFTRRSVIEQFK